MRNSTLVFRTIALAYLAACGSSVAGPQTSLSEAQIGEEFSLGVGDAIKLAGVDLRLEFTGVSGDSRCPTRAECIWAGDGAVVLVSRSAGGVVQEDTLHTNVDPRSILLGTVELTLLRLDPYPETPGSIPDDDYVATLTSRVP